MRPIRTTGIIFLSLLFSIVVVCEAQERRGPAAERPQDEDVAVGFRCPSGESNQPRPEVRSRLGDVTKKALELPQPKYPQQAKTDGISGRVRAEVVIRIDTGEVAWARIVDGHPLLQEAVRKVVCQARFAPTLYTGQVIRVSGIIVYRFANRKRVPPNSSTRLLNR